MLKELPENLHTFFFPQMEQLHMLEKRADFGGLAALPQELGEGTLWVAGLGDNCLLSIHDFSLREEVLLREYPEKSYCISLMSASTARVTPMSDIQPLRERNTLMLYQDGSDTQFTLPANTRHWATTLCFTEEYFERARELTGIEPHVFEDALLEAAPNRLPIGVVRCLDRLRPAARDSAASRCIEYAAIALEALSLLVEPRCREHDERMSDNLDKQMPPESVRKVVDAAKAYMESNLAEDMTLEDLSRKLYVSKTSLCNAFRQSEGMGAATYLARLRITRAKELLRSSDLTVGEISRLVGYRHQSSFCDAFKRQCGVTPSALR